MFEQIDFNRRRCVRTVIEVVKQIPGRWYARSPMILDESTVGLLLIWSWLRWESDFLTRCLEELGVDLAAFSRQVDDLLNQRKTPVESRHDDKRPSMNPHILEELRGLTVLWLDLAADEARLLNQEYLGMEHLLLALLRHEGTHLALLFSSYRIDHRRLKEAVLKKTGSGQLVVARLVELDRVRPTTFWQKLGSRPAVGMPKRFSMAIMMAWVTLFAVAFSVLTWLETPPEIFGIIAVLMFCIGIGQMWLFGGKNPRAASVWTGAWVLSVEVFALNVATGYFIAPTSSIFPRILQSFLLLILCIPLGMFLGYLLGGLTAGIVLVLDHLEKKKADKGVAETEEESGDI